MKLRRNTHLRLIPNLNVVMGMTKRGGYPRVCWRFTRSSMPDSWASVRVVTLSCDVTWMVFWFSD